MISAVFEIDFTGDTGYYFSCEKIYYKWEIIFIKNFLREPYKPLVVVAKFHLLFKSSISFKDNSLAGTTRTAPSSFNIRTE